MAKNLRAKIAESDTMIVYDVTSAATEKLQKEAGNVKVAKNVREVAEKAVCQIASIPDCYGSKAIKMIPYCSIYDLS